MEVGYPKSHHDILFLLDRSLALRHALEQFFFNILKKHTCIANIFFNFSFKTIWRLLLPIFDPTKKSRKKEKENKKIQEDTHEESLEGCPSCW